MNEQQQNVTEFHETFGHPAPEFPAETLTPELEAEFRKRAKWLHEEATELEEACDEGDLIKALDAFIDSKYFATGGFVVAGHDEQPYWDNAHESNMDKLDPVTKKPILRPSDGKIMKRDGWVPPEPRHEETLRQAVHLAHLESAARQFAWLQTTDPEAPITVAEGFTAEDLIAVMNRAQAIVANGQAEELYDRMVAELEVGGAE